MPLFSVEWNCSLPSNSTFNSEFMIDLLPPDEILQENSKLSEENASMSTSGFTSALDDSCDSFLDSLSSCGDVDSSDVSDFFVL